MIMNTSNSLKLTKIKKMRLKKFTTKNLSVILKTIYYN